MKVFFDTEFIEDGKTIDLTPQLPNIFDFWLKCQCAYPSANCQKSDCPRRIMTWSSTNAT